MSQDSVSFRITRSTEDLAQAIHALSHRLVRLEQRFAALELTVQAIEVEPTLSEQESTSLNHAERLLADCRSLLAIDDESPDQPNQSSADQDHSHYMAA